MTAELKIYNPRAIHYDIPHGCGYYDSYVDHTPAFNVATLCEGEGMPDKEPNLVASRYTLTQEELDGPTPGMEFLRKVVERRVEEIFNTRRGVRKRTILLVEQTAKLSPKSVYAESYLGIREVLHDVVYYADFPDEVLIGQRAHVPFEASSRSVPEGFTLKDLVDRITRETALAMDIREGHTFSLGPSFFSGHIRINGDEHYAGRVLDEFYLRDEARNASPFLSPIYFTRVRPYLKTP